MIHISRFFVIFVAVFVLIGCIPGREAKLIESYRIKMEPLRGRSLDEVNPMITGEWKFELLTKWAAVSPGPELIIKRNHRRAPFSDEEAQEIFGAKGRYDVVYYILKSSEKVSREWDMEEDMWLTTHEHSHNTVNYILARLVFREDKLHHYRFFKTEVSN